MTSPAPPGAASWLPKAQLQQLSPLQLVGYARSVVHSDPADANGQAIARFPELEHDTSWLIDYVMLEAPTDHQCTGFLFEGEPSIGGLMAATNDGRLDINECNQPLYLPAGAQLHAAWSGAAPGTVCLARVQYRVIRTGG